MTNNLPTPEDFNLDNNNEEGSFDILEVNQHIKTIEELMYTLNPFEDDIIHLISKGRSVNNVSTYMVDLIKEHDDSGGDLEVYDINGHEMDYNVTKKKLIPIIEEFIEERDIRTYIESLKLKDNKTIIKAQLETISFSLYQIILKKIKLGQFNNEKPKDLVDMSQKILKSLHLEQERTKEVVKDICAIIQDHYKIYGLGNAYITEEDGFNLYDKKFFKNDIANPSANFMDSDEVTFIDHDKHILDDKDDKKE